MEGQPVVQNSASGMEQPPHGQDLGQFGPDDSVNSPSLLAKRKNQPDGPPPPEETSTYQQSAPKRTPHPPGYAPTPNPQGPPPPYYSTAGQAAPAWYPQQPPYYP